MAKHSSICVPIQTPGIPGGDELYAVAALYLASGVTGTLKITDGESFELKYFGKDELPNLESRAKVILDWLIEEKYI